ncbi:POU domain, class 6, transcription factor 2-like [Neomonachus schauinslandi]|uniref:POU domain, class 6, transcription factor 2-like n=1 Tax=Neomonachus schauinslandi TaxID=29088 RepID=A0A8M1MTV3_NEOSC|nr:POU domain, class 6, transcription factor 2-like [Neomonachus schauinslandi]
MIAGQVSKPLLSARSEMNAELRGEDKAATSDSELNEPLLEPVESNDSEDTPSKLFGARGNPALSDPGTPDQHQASQTHSPFPVGPQPLLTAQQLASAVAGVMPGGTPALNQPILIPFNMAGQLGGQQGLVLTLPTANLTNIQGLVAAAAAGGIMTLPLQNLQAIIIIIIIIIGVFASSNSSRKLRPGESHASGQSLSLSFSIAICSMDVSSQKERD